jgi:Zn-dependent protease
MQGQQVQPPEQRAGADGGQPPGTNGQPPAPEAKRDPRLGLVIARVFGIPIYVSPYWFLVAALLVYLYANSLDSDVQPELTRYLVSAAFVILLYASVLVHELSHCAVARAFKLAVRRVLLYPLGGFSEIEEEPPTPAKEFLVSVAGPVISLVLAGIAAVLTKLVPDGLPNLLIDQLFRANLLVGIFNLLPGLPLDGGRIFRAGIWKVTGKAVTATIAAAWAGRVLAVALILVPLVIYRGDLGSVVNSGYSLWLAFIAVFMWLQSGQAIKSAKVRERLPGLQARTLARRAIPIPSDLPLAEAIRRADAAQARALVVVNHESTPIAIVNEDAVMATPPQRRPWVEVGTLARTLDPGMVLSADLSGMELIDAVRKVPASEYLLIEPSGQVYGVLAATDLDHAFAGV